MTVSLRHLAVRIGVTFIVGTAMALSYPASVFSQERSNGDTSNKGDARDKGDRPQTGGQPGGTPGKPATPLPPLAGAPAAPNPSAPPKSPAPARSYRAARTFLNPKIRGIRVDWCMTDTLSGCGTGSATVWCQSQGYSQALSYSWKLAPPTYRQGDAGICTLICGGFTSVTCQ